MKFFVHLFILAMALSFFFNSCKKVKTESLPSVPSNQAPSVYAGLDQIILLPTNSTKLVSVAKDIDGSIVSFQWSKKSGPQQYTLIDSTKSIVEIKDLIKGYYEFDITVADDRNLYASDQVKITVLDTTVGNGFVFIDTAKTDSACSGCWDY